MDEPRSVCTENWNMIVVRGWANFSVHCTRPTEKSWTLGLLFQNNLSFVLGKFLLLWNWLISSRFNNFTFYLKTTTLMNTWEILVQGEENLIPPMKLIFKILFIILKNRKEFQTNFLTPLWPKQRAVKEFKKSPLTTLYSFPFSELELFLFTETVWSNT